MLPWALYRAAKRHGYGAVPAVEGYYRDRPEGCAEPRLAAINAVYAESRRELRLLPLAREPAGTRT